MRHRQKNIKLLIAGSKCFLSPTDAQVNCLKTILKLH